MNKREIKKDIQRRIKCHEETIELCCLRVLDPLNYGVRMGIIRELKDILKGIDLWQ